MSMEFREFKFPDEVITKFEQGIEKGAPITVGESGLLDWLTKMSQTEGWRPVWQTINPPFLVLEREVKKS